MKLKTKISKLTEDDLILRGEKLSHLISSSSFSESIFLLLNKRKPSEVENKVFSALLISCIDHGAGTASSLSSRFIMSTGNSLNTAVSGGILALGDYHGGASEKAMEQLKKVKDVKAFVSKTLKNKEIIFGYGHKIHKNEDPRVKEILKLCKSLEYDSKYIKLAQEIETSIEKTKGKKLCLNIDGLMAAILLEMGFSPLAARGVFIIARTPGLVAQAIEEKETEKPVRRLDEKDISYEDE